MVFSCSSGSLSAITPCLPKNSHWQKLLNASTLLVAAVTRRRRAPSERNRSSVVAYGSLGDAEAAGDLGVGVTGNHLHPAECLQPHRRRHSRFPGRGRSVNYVLTIGRRSRRCRGAGLSRLWPHDRAHWFFVILAGSTPTPNAVVSAMSSSRSSIPSWPSWRRTRPGPRPHQRADSPELTPRQGRIGCCLRG